jgi:hypothetical protein
MKLKVLFVLLVFQMGFGQHRTCGTQALMQQIMADPVRKQAYLEQQAKFELELQKTTLNKNANSTNSTNALIIIPVAVHFPSVTAGTAAQKTCLRNLAQSQVNILNADYNAANSDISNWAAASSYYPMVTSVGNLNVQFVLATLNHPASSGIASGTVAVTFGTDFLSDADSDTTWSGYMNLVVRDLGPGLLGYSPLGGSPSAGHTVVIDNSAFGSGSGCTGYVPVSPYNLGRTLTHELGHFFNLDHTFNEGTPCSTSSCTFQGDRICDTPQVLNESYNCPAPGTVPGCTAGQYALTMNFMDYVNDACMYMFTLGQENRMRTYYNAISTQFKTNVLANTSFVENSFSLYPNPNKGSFTIEFKELTGSYSIEVFDVTGQVVYNNNYEQSANLVQTVNLQNAATGVYFVNIKTEQGLFTKKLLIQ